MTARWTMATTLALAGAVAACAPGTDGDRQAPSPRLNPMITLLEARQPVFGLYAPSNRRDATVRKSAAELAREALGEPSADYIFDGAMEHDFDAGYAAFTDFMRGTQEAGPLRPGPTPQLHHPLVVKTPEIAPDPALARERIAKQLDLGVSTIVFVGVESAEEVRQGLAAMRFAANGGTRPDRVGEAPAYWGVSEEAYKAKADVWPLNPQGELTAWVIVESKAGLEKVREIAAVEGIGALFPGAGTLRGVFSTTGADGKRVLDEEAWEGAIQQVLAACKEFQVACGYPANVNDIETRMQQGFSVFVIGWGEPGVRTIEIGRRVAGRPATNGE